MSEQVVRKKGRGDAGSPPEALLEAAFDVFAARGYRASRLEEVAEAAGLTKGAIYYYFDGKEDLLRRAVQHRHRSMFGELERALAEEGAPAAARIRLVLRRMWQHWLAPDAGDAIRLVLGEVSVELPALFRLWAQEGPIHGWTLVRRLIEEGVENGEFRADVDAEVSARLVVSGLMLQATLHEHLGLADLAPCETDRIFDSSVDVFLHGLAVTHGAPGGRAGPG
ncbi:MAG: TetR family transcriptional regulator [Gemmatimonadota bacterium]